MTSARVRRKPADPDVEPVKPPPTKRGQEISTDTYIVARSADDKKTAHGGECCVQTVRDSFSGVIVWLIHLSRGRKMKSKMHYFILVQTSLAKPFR